MSAERAAINAMLIVGGEWKKPKVIGTTKRGVRK
jgi:hypothetical protein